VNFYALTVKCYYREHGIQCISGKLYHADLTPVLLEGTGVYCPACEGKGCILTDKGRDLLMFLQNFGRPVVSDVVEEILEKREKHG
jgi:hypothetical protein